MKNSIIRIGTFVVIALIFAGIYFINVFRTFEIITIGTKTSDIFIKENGTIEVIDNVQIERSQSRKKSDKSAISNS